MKTKEQVGWKTLDDLKSFRTNDPKKILGMFLAEPMIQYWTEDFIDEDTGEPVSIERNQLLINRGVQITEDKLQDVMFYLQSGDIEDVCVCSENAYFKRFIGGRLLSYEVTIFADCGKENYLVRATSIEKAIECLRNYAAIYLKRNTSFSVQAVKAVAYEIVEDDDEAVSEVKEKDVEDSEYEYYKVLACEYNYNEEKMKMEKSDSVIIIKAGDVGEAKKRSLAWIEGSPGNPAVAPMGSTVIVKAMPYSTDGIVPKAYCELFKEKPTI